MLTEAATGAYVVTPVLAAAAGARVDAITRTTRHGSVDDVVAATSELARLIGVDDRITVHTAGLEEDLVAHADIVTNSGHLRPIDERVVGWMRPEAVVPLMFESWEIDLGRDDVDLDALGRRGVRFAGTNERHSEVDVFNYLGPMAVKLLADAAVATYRSRILLLCDNPFLPFLQDGLRRSGADVVARIELDADDLDARLDTILVALRPRGEPVLSGDEVRAIAERAGGALVAQFWGDLPRDACDAAGIAYAPAAAPGAGHMGVLPSAVGPEPIVRLQAGGLKVGELLLRDPSTWTDDEAGYVDEV